MSPRRLAPTLATAALAAGAAAALAGPASAAWTPPLTLARPAAENLAAAGNDGRSQVFAWKVTTRRRVRTATRSGLESFIRARIRQPNGRLGASRVISARRTIVANPSIGVDHRGNAIAVWAQAGSRIRIMGVPTTSPRQTTLSVSRRPVSSRRLIVATRSRPSFSGSQARAPISRCRRKEITARDDRVSGRRAGVARRLIAISSRTRVCRAAILARGMAKPVVFISHVHHEQAVAVALELVLGTALLGGLEIFNASNRKSLVAGDPWRDRIVGALRQAACVLVLASPDSLQSPWVNFEAGGAWTAGTRVVPCCIKGLQPGSLTSPLRDLQGLDLADAEGLRILVRLLADVADLDFPANYDIDAGSIALRQSWSNDDAPSGNSELIEWLAKANRRPTKYRGESQTGYFRLDVKGPATPGDISQLHREELQAGDSVRCWMEIDGVEHSTEYHCFARGDVADALESADKTDLLVGRVKCLGQIKVYSWDVPPLLLDDEERGIEYPAAWLIESAAVAGTSTI